MKDNGGVKEAVSKAKAALDKIKIKKEKHGEGKEAVEVSKLDNPEEFDDALGEAKTALEACVVVPPPPVDISGIRYSIDKIALVKGNADHVKSAIEDAKTRLDDFDKKHQEQEKQQQQNHEKQQQDKQQAQKNQK